MAGRVSRSTHLKLGIIGLSEGNGHPWSWSAICNGYDPAVMADCPYPAIPAYLARQRFPQDQLTGVSVTHVWTQDAASSSHIARAAHVPTVVRNFRDMLGQVDAVLLARDDAECHLEFAEPFLRAGLAVYVDKPVALSLAQLDALFALARVPTQIFSCSALRFAAELRLAPEEADRIGRLRSITAVVPKSWARYAVHAIDPIVALLKPGRVLRAERHAAGSALHVSLEWENECTGEISASGEPSGEIELTYVGEHASVRKVFADSFAAFRAALQCFLDGVRRQQSASPYEQLRAVVELIELGMR